MKKMFFITITLIMTLMSCRRTYDIFDENVFGIRQGHTVRISSIKITLDSIQDSRCAEGVACIWEGEAVAKMTFTKGNDRLSKSLKVMGVARNPKPDTVVVFDRRAILLNVFPYPHVNHAIPQRDYFVFMKLE